MTANAIHVIDHVHGGGPIVGGRVRESHAALKARAAPASRLAGRGALSFTGEFILVVRFQHLHPVCIGRESKCRKQKNH
jgi:hypothetical protein